ncbi:hypothetical protein CFIMG_005128RA [Ceratocystis fimbriata CBS 114723]|uniref:Uncharacterized protein n=1 Tax=Ceratocystis fimbriata CBS 114723 TaxID=1035309 RepID=A0A2C5WWW2_9PEZI|nr:hypothetical protein CFIMG_005128RA [Ceratocystis fimbriata CBS 114723]
MKPSVVLLVGASTASATSWLSWPSWLSWASWPNKGSDPRPYSGLDGSTNPSVPDITIMIESLSLSPETMTGVVTVGIDCANDNLPATSIVPPPTFTPTPTSFTTTTAPPTITDASVRQNEDEFVDISLVSRKRGLVGNVDANGRPWIEYAANLYSTSDAPAATGSGRGSFGCDSDEECDDVEDLDKGEEKKEEEDELMFDMSLATSHGRILELPEKPSSRVGGKHGWINEYWSRRPTTLTTMTRVPTTSSPSNVPTADVENKPSDEDWPEMFEMDLSDDVEDTADTTKLPKASSVSES